MARSDQTRFLVRILEGRLSPGVVSLEGRMLPFRPSMGGQIEFGIEQRTKLTWYPGNPVGSQQRLGPTLAPMTINGLWRDRYLGENVANKLAETFEELVESGVEVEVLWQTKQRRGIVKSIRYTPGTPDGGIDSMAWSITFEWNRKGTHLRPKIGTAVVPLRDQYVATAQAVGDFGLATEAYLDDYDSTVGLSRLALAPTVQSLSDGLGRIANAQNTLLDAAAQTGREFSPGGRRAGAASAAVREIEDVTTELAATTAAIFPGDVIPDDTPAAFLREAKARHALLDSARRALRENHTSRMRIEDQLRPETHKYVTAVAGADLRKYSSDHYGSPDYWRRIARYNGITGSEVPEGLDVLRIPLSASASLDNSDNV